MEKMLGRLEAEEKGVTEDEMGGCYHHQWLSGHGESKLRGGRVKDRGNQACAAVKWVAESRPQLNNGTTTW